MKKLIILISAFSLLGSAQVFAQTKTGVAISHHEASVATSTPKIFAVPIVADTQLISEAATTFEMKEEIKIPAYNQYDAKYQENLTNFIKAKIAELKSKALFDYAEKVGADVILSPMYSITTDSSEGMAVTVKIKIKGYPAKYTNFRSLEAKDYTLIQASTLVAGSSQRQSLSNLSNNETVTTKEIK